VKILLKPINKYRTEGTEVGQFGKSEREKVKEDESSVLFEGRGGGGRV